MMFYERLAPLNRDVHGQLRVRTDGVGYAARTNSSPVLGVEIVEASRSFPILFVDIGNEQLFPIALLGLRNKQNLFIGADGVWEDAAHVPAFVRRYPFVLSSDMTVYIDESFPGFSQIEGEPLFTRSGENAPILDHAISFLLGFHEAVEQTHGFVRRLRQLDLLLPVSLNVVPEAGSRYQIDGLKMIDASRLAALNDADALQLFRSGELSWIHAHLASLAEIEELNRRSNARARIDSADGGTKTSASDEAGNQNKMAAQTAETKEG